MNGVLATLAAISAFASLSLALSALLADFITREVSIILWAVTLTVAVVVGTLARKAAARERVGLGRSTIGLMLSLCSLIVGIVAFLV